MKIHFIHSVSYSTKQFSYHAIHIKFSDGDLQVAKAYRDGGCAQLAVSRAKHLQALNEEPPNGTPAPASS